MVAMNTIFLSLVLAFVSIFGAIGENIKNIDFNNLKIEITGEKISTLEGKEYKDEFSLKGIKENNKVNYNLKTKSDTAKSYDLNYYFDGKDTYFNRDSVLLNAGDRADDSLKEINEDFIKIKGAEAFGFEEKYNLNILTTIFDYLNDEKFLESILKISNFLEKSEDFPKMNGNSIKIDFVELLNNNKLNEYISKNYNEVENELIYIGNKIYGDEYLNKEHLEEIFKGERSKNYKELIKIFKGSYVKVNVNESKGLDVDLEINFSLNGEDESESVRYLTKTNIKLENSKEKVDIPKNFKEVSSTEYNDFFLSTYSDIAVINISDGKDNKNISYKKDLYPVLKEDSIYVDRHVINQVIENYNLNDKIKLEKDKLIVDGKEIKAVDGLYPLRKSAESMGYRVEFTMGEDAPRFYVDLIKQ